MTLDSYREAGAERARILCPHGATAGQIEAAARILASEEN